MIFWEGGEWKKCFWNRLRLTAQELQLQGPSLLHCWLTRLLRCDLLDPVLPKNLPCTHLSTSACERDRTYERITWPLLWKMGRITKRHQTGTGYFYNLSAVPWSIQLWWDFHHLSDITVTCEELWFNYAPSTEKLKWFHTNPLRTGVVVLFKQRVVALTYLSIPAWETHFCTWTNFVWAFFSPFHCLFLVLF